MNYLTLVESTIEDLTEIANKFSRANTNSNSMQYIPLVECRKTMNLICMIKADELKDYMDLFYSDMPNTTCHNHEHAHDLDQTQFFQPKDLKEGLI